MKKSTLLILSVIICIPLFSQWSGQVPAIKMDMKKRTPVLKNDTREKQSRAPGDTLYLFDFSNPANWTTWHNGSSIDWVIENSANAGGTTLGDVLSGNNIAVPPQAVFDAYYYLSYSIVPPVYDGYLEYTGPMLDFTAHPSVFIKWHQWHWAFNYDHCNLEITTDDGASWIMFNDLFAGYGVCSSIPAYQTVNLSSICGGQDSVRFRFSYYCDNTDVNYGGGYGWILDDVAFVEWISDDVEITNVYPNFSWMNWQGTYHKIPCYVQTSYITYGDYPVPGRIWFGAEVHNVGTNTAEELNLEVTITDHGSSNTYYSESTVSPINSLAYDCSDSLGTDTLHPFIFNSFPGSVINLYPGFYDINFEVMTSTPDSFPDNNSELFTFEISDTVYAVDNNPVNPGSVSPCQWSSGGNDLDEIGVIYDNWLDNGIVSSMYVYISDETTFDSTGISVTIRGVLYEYDGAGSYSPVLMSDIIDVDSIMINKWLRIPFMRDGFSEFLTINEYLAAIEVVSYNGQEIYFGEDEDSPQSIYKTAWFFPSEGQWYFLSNYNKSPMIRLVYWLHPTNSPELNSLNICSELFPNPFTENTDLYFELPEPASVRLVISDVTGKTIKVTDAGKLEAGRNQIQITSEGMEDGIYYYSLYAGGMKASGKMVVIR